MALVSGSLSTVATTPSEVSQVNISIFNLKSIQRANYFLTALNNWQDLQEE